MPPEFLRRVTRQICWTSPQTYGSQRGLGVVLRHMETEFRRGPPCIMDDAPAHVIRGDPPPQCFAMMSAVFFLPAIGIIGPGGPYWGAPVSSLAWAGLPLHSRSWGRRETRVDQLVLDGRDLIVAVPQDQDWAYGISLQNFQS